MTHRLLLGIDGPEIPRIGLGTFSFSHAYGHADPDESRATLLRALELEMQAA